MTIEDIQHALTAMVEALERGGDDHAAAYVAQAKVDLRRAQALLEPGEPMRVEAGGRP